MKEYSPIPGVRIYLFGYFGINSLRHLFGLAVISSTALIFLYPNISQAVTVYAKVTARIIPALQANVVNGLSFGDLSSGNTAGEITIPATAPRRISSGGVVLRSGDNGAPAMIRVIGAKNMSYGVHLPVAIHLVDEHGQEMTVDRFKTSAGTGHLDGRGLQEVRIGGHLLVPARQGVGTYSGTLPVEIDYN